MIESFYSNEEQSAVEAKFEAQKLAFGAVAFQATVALRDLNILTCLFERDKEGATISEIATTLGLSEYGVRVLLEMGLSLNLVRYLDDRFHLTKTGFFVLKDQLTRVNINFMRDVCYLGMDRLKESIVTGKPEGLKVFGEWPTVYEGLSQLPHQARTSWLEFDHFYSDQTFSTALPHVFRIKPKMIFDIGGNTGKWAIKCLDYDPEVKVTIIDLPGQISLAKENLKDHPGRERVLFHESNMLDPLNELPKGVDVIWMSQFLDCFSESEIISILKKAKTAMDPHSRLIINETFWDHQRYEAAAYSLHATSLYFTAMANGNSQMYHSGLFEDLIGKAGLKLEETQRDIGISHSLMVVTLP